jgi:hypothetical protein
MTTTTTTTTVNKPLSLANRRVRLTTPATGLEGLGTAPAKG